MLVWRVKLVAELETGSVSETELARIERDDFAVLETLGLTLDKSKRLVAAARAEVVRAQVATMGERFRWALVHMGAPSKPMANPSRQRRSLRPRSEMLGFGWLDTDRLENDRVGGKRGW